MSTVAAYFIAAAVCSAVLVAVNHERGEKPSVQESIIAACLSLFWPILLLASIPYLVKIVMARRLP